MDLKYNLSAKAFKGIVLIFLFINMTIDSKSENINDRLSFDFSCRYRFESWNGMNAKNFGDEGQRSIGNLNDNMLLQRIITGFSYRINDNTFLGVHLQDSRTFGWSLSQAKEPELFKIRKAGSTEPYYIMNPNEEFIEIYDAYLIIKNDPNDFFITIGRQKISDGDNRIFGPGDWGNTGRWTWDALRLTYYFNNSYINIWAGGTKVHNPLKISIPFMETEYWGLGLYSSFLLSNSIRLEPYLALKKNGTANYIKDLDISRNWLGFRFVDSNFYYFDYDINYSREFGKDNGKDISAYGFFARLGYKFDFLPAKPLLSLRYSFASGGRNNEQKIRTFEPAFGAQDKFYGWMNIVSWSNLDDREVVLELFPMKNFWIELKYNSFRIPSATDTKILGTLEFPEGKNHLGDEIDFFGKFNVNVSLQLIAATGIFFPADAVLASSMLKPKNAFWFALQAVYYFKYFLY